MKARNLLLLVVLVVLVVGVGLLTQYRADGKAPSKKTVDFTLKDVNGKPVKLSDYRGKVVVVDVWATWCPYCVQEIPDLMDIQAQATKEKQPVQFIGIAMDSDRSPVKPFVTEHKMNYPVLYGEKKALKPFGDVYGLPTKFIIGKDGVIVDKIIGAREKSDLQKVLGKYLK
ncbi:MAG TPA: TlpA disulfide reductase family protein [Armatimonadota bacterium]|jgi:peroxiredoxin